MDENDFIFCVLHKSQGKFRIRNLFYWVSDNHFQTLHQHLILVYGDLPCFLFCTGYGAIGSSRFQSACTEGEIRPLRRFVNPVARYTFLNPEPSLSIADHSQKCF